MAAPSSGHTMPAQTTTRAPRIQPSIACGPCIVATISGTVMNGPTPIMSIMFSAVACARPMPRSSFTSVCIDNVYRNAVAAFLVLGAAMIRIFVTGGTFDKTYDEIKGQLSFGETHLPEMLRLGRSRADVEIRTLMMIDSLQMTGADRDLIVRSCQDCAETCIVITHGTDTMVETAAAIARGVHGKTVVLTGAMIPYAFGSSDGLFNLGSALSLVQVLKPGVYIAMNGKFFPWDQVRKNRDRGEFEPI